MNPLRMLDETQPEKYTLSTKLNGASNSAIGVAPLEVKDFLASPEEVQQQVVDAYLASDQFYQDVCRAVEEDLQNNPDIQGRIMSCEIENITVESVEHTDNFMLDVEVVDPLQSEDDPQREQATGKPWREFLYTEREASAHRSRNAQRVSWSGEDWLRGVEPNPQAPEAGAGGLGGGGLNLAWAAAAVAILYATSQNPNYLQETVSSLFQGSETTAIGSQGLWPRENEPDYIPMPGTPGAIERERRLEEDLFKDVERVQVEEVEHTRHDDDPNLIWIFRAVDQDEYDDIVAQGWHDWGYTVPYPPLGEGIPNQKYFTLTLAEAELYAQTFSERGNEDYYVTGALIQESAFQYVWISNEPLGGRLVIQLQVNGEDIKDFYKHLRSPVVELGSYIVSSNPLIMVRVI